MALDSTNVAFGFSSTFFAFPCKHGLKFFCQQLSVDARVFYCHFMQLKYTEQTNREKYKPVTSLWKSNKKTLACGVGK